MCECAQVYMSVCVCNDMVKRVGPETTPVDSKCVKKFKDERMMIRTLAGLLLKKEREERASLKA